MEKFKSFLSEGKLKAEDYEAAIVIGFYEIQGKKATPAQMGITDSVYKTIQANPVAMETGKRVATFLLKKYPNLKGKKAEQYGRAKSSLTPFWKSHGGSDTTPKTDILIGDMRISLKIGLAQLMSGGKAESTATFYAAVNESSNKLVKDPQFQKTKDILEGFVTNTLAPSQLRPLIKSGENEVVNKGEKAHKDAMKELGLLFENNRDFKIAFAREAMSGFQKYGKDSASAAEWMLVSTHDGKNIQLHSVEDDGYCERIADKMRLQARFKTSSRKLKGDKTGEYNFWSVISLIVDAMDESFEEHEDLEMISEVNLAKIARKVKNKVSSAWSNITKFFKQGVRRVISFLGLEPDIKTNKKVKF